MPISQGIAMPRCQGIRQGMCMPYINVCTYECKYLNINVL